MLYYILIISCGILHKSWPIHILLHRDDGSIFDELMDAEVKDKAKR